MIFLFLLALFASTHAFPSHITVFGDVHKDVEFFTRTFPWIIDNIGGDLVVVYHLLGSGRYSVPQTCALGFLVGNTFLQAQYLRCEAKGYPSEYCLCEAGISPDTFQICVAHGGYIASGASEKYSELGINISPIVELEPNSTVYGVDDVSFLQKICTTFGDHVPRGCVHYSNQTDSFLAQKALAQFDRACQKEFPIEDDTPVTPDPEWLTTSTPLPTATSHGTTPPWWWSTTPWVTQTTQTPWSTPRPTDGPDGTAQTTPDWWSTTPPWWWSTTPWVTQTTPTPWSTPRPTDGPDGTAQTTPDWWSTTPPWWWSTTPWVTQTTPTPWSTPRPTEGSTQTTGGPTTSEWWGTTPPWWWSTTPWVTQTTPTPWSSPRPTEGSTQTTGGPTTSEWWGTTPPWWWSTTSPPWWSTTSPPWWSTTSPPWWLTTPSTTSPPWWLTTPSTTSPPWWLTTPSTTRTTPTNPWLVKKETNEDSVTEDPTAAIDPTAK